MQLRRCAIAVNTLFAVAIPLTSLTAAAQGAQDVAPQFVSFPRLPLDLPEANRGHFVIVEDGFAPAPLVHAPTPGAPAPLAPRSSTASGGTFSTNVSNAADSYQGETGAASNGTTIVAGSNSIFPGACGSNPCYVRAYASGDGATWVSSTISGTWHNTTFGITFDPSIDVDSAGNYYFAFGGAPLSGSYPNSVAVAKAGPSGTGWGTPVAVTFNRNQFFDDKYYIGIDRSGGAFNNRIYVTWDRNTSTNQILYVAFSSDGGASFSAPVKVDDGTSKFERVIGAYPAVDQRNGTVYIAWHNYAKDIIFVDKSTTGGTSWGTDVAAATTHTAFGVDIGCVGGRQQSPAHHLKVGTDGTLHLVYADQIAGKGFDILYKRSTNGGATWSSPVTLNDDVGGAHQFHPTLNVQPGLGGDVVSVSFYDRRDDPANCLTQVYATKSTDGGLSWSANARLTAVASDFDGNPNGPGDYSSSTAFASQAWPFHSQHPAGQDFEVYTFPF